MTTPIELTPIQARRIWLHAQRLDTVAPFGSGPEATPVAIAHLGYVQIDTIHVIERCHHHILYTRIPDYRREHLHRAQSSDKTVFEYWTHALSYLPVGDFRYYVRDMRRSLDRGSIWLRKVKAGDLRRVLSRIRRHGALTIRDIEDDVLVDKEFAWSSRKPSRHALQLAFYQGRLTISQRTGMLKSHELTTRHFGWERLPRAATERETLDYLLDRGLRSQGIVSLDSVCYLNARRKASIRKLIDRRVRRGELVPVQLQGADKWLHWARPDVIAAIPEPAAQLTHILSPFDPLIIQRKRLQLFFDYEHRFEAYVPKHKRVFGYFVCPVLVGDEIVAAVDLKTDRQQGKLLIQHWHWVGHGMARRHKKPVEQALHAFEKFQLGK